MNYFLSAIIDQQRSFILRLISVTEKYKIEQTVYTIVGLTAPYTVKTIDKYLSKINSIKNKGYSLVMLKI